MSDPADRPKSTSQKVIQLRPARLADPADTADPIIPDSIVAWVGRYQQLAVAGVRSLAVAHKIALHLERFQAFFLAAYGHERISACLQRDVLAWQAHLKSCGLAHATINNHLASLSTFTTWVSVQAPQLFALGDPAKGIHELALPPLEPRALSDDQVRSLKSVCDRLPRFHQLKGRTRHSQHNGEDNGKNGPPLHSAARPWRDRAIVYLLLSTGLRREELVRLDLEQLTPHTPDDIRAVHRLRINRVQGKGHTERSVFVSADARTALADYLQRERHRDTVGIGAAGEGKGNGESNGGPLFLSAVGIPHRAEDGRLSPRAINLILEQIGRWHDAEISDHARHISPLHPHALRHTFAFQLARVTGSDPYELERRLGHRSQRYIARYTNPPEAVAATYVEEF